MEKSEGMNRIVTCGVLPAVEDEINKCVCEGKQTVDGTVAAIRLIIDAYDKYYETGRTR